MLRCCWRHQLQATPEHLVQARQSAQLSLGVLRYMPGMRQQVRLVEKDTDPLSFFSGFLLLNRGVNIIPWL